MLILAAIDVDSVSACKIFQVSVCQWCQAISPHSYPHKRRTMALVLCVVVVESVGKLNVDPSDNSPRQNRSVYFDLCRPL